TAAADSTSFVGQMALNERWTWVFAKIGREYGIKIVVAILLTPAVYAIHAFVVRVLAIQPESHETLRRRDGA
ncbi:MAG: putative preQ0 transporter, partial [Labilithrix sp.]|nr:putative preQ0 transporter [Labilithrix sp.]